MSHWPGAGLLPDNGHCGTRVSPGLGALISYEARDVSAGGCVRRGHEWLRVAVGPNSARPWCPIPTITARALSARSTEGNASCFTFPETLLAGGIVNSHILQMTASCPSPHAGEGEWGDLKPAPPFLNFTLLLWFLTPSARGPVCAPIGFHQSATYWPGDLGELLGHGRTLI